MKWQTLASVGFYQKNWMRRWRCLRIQGCFWCSLFFFGFEHVPIFFGFKQMFMSYLWNTEILGKQKPQRILMLFLWLWESVLSRICVEDLEILVPVMVFNFPANPVPPFCTQNRKIRHHDCLCFQRTAKTHSNKKPAYFSNSFGKRT